MPKFTIGLALAGLAAANAQTFELRPEGSLSLAMAAPISLAFGNPGGVITLDQSTPVQLATQASPLVLASTPIFLAAPAPQVAPVVMEVVVEQLIMVNGKWAFNPAWKNPLNGVEQFIMVNGKWALNPAWQNSLNGVVNTVVAPTNAPIIVVAPVVAPVVVPTAAAVNSCNTNIVYPNFLCSNGKWVYTGNNAVALPGATAAPEFIKNAQGIWIKNPLYANNAVSVQAPVLPNAASTSISNIGSSMGFNLDDSYFNVQNGPLGVSGAQGILGGAVKVPINTYFGVVGAYSLAGGDGGGTFTLNNNGKAIRDVSLQQYSGTLDNLAGNPLTNGLYDFIRANANNLVPVGGTGTAQGAMEAIEAMQVIEG